MRSSTPAHPHKVTAAGSFWAEMPDSTAVLIHFAEVSGKNFLDFQGTANLSSRFGSLGTLLLDPTNVTIEDGGSAAATDVDEAFADAGTNVSIDADTLVAVNGNVKVQATADLTVDEEISASGASLQLASGGLILNAPISTNGGDIHIIVASDGLSGSYSTKIVEARQRKSRCTTGVILVWVQRIVNSLTAQ